MTQAVGPASTGFSLERIYFPEQSHRLLERSEDLPDEPGLQFGWNWKFNDERFFEVMIHVTVGPSRSRPEETKVFVCGVFGLTGEPGKVAVSDFVRIHGPAILFPYAREAVSALTGRSFFGPQYLPPVNLMQVMEDMDLSAAVGARQLQEREQRPPRREKVK